MTKTAENSAFYIRIMILAAGIHIMDIFIYDDRNAILLP